MSGQQDQYVAADLNQDGRTTRSEAKAFRSGKLSNKASKVEYVLTVLAQYNKTVSGKLTNLFVVRVWYYYSRM